MSDYGCFQWCGVVVHAEIGVPEDLKFGHWGNSYPAHITDNDNKTFLGLDEQSLQSLALLSPGMQVMWADNDFV